MSEAAGRALPNARVRRFLLAIQEVMGRSGLITILRQAGLQRYAGALPPGNREPGMTAAEYAAMMQAIENYYGRGARGTLIRIGHCAFEELVKSRKLQATLYQLGFRLMPLPTRKLAALRWLARDLAAPGGQVTVHLDDRRLVFVDHESDATHGRTRDIEICWVTLGEIQAALKWCTGSEHDVVETSCQARGDLVCRFDVGEALSPGSP